MNDSFNNFHATDVIENSGGFDDFDMHGDCDGSENVVGF